MSVLKVILVSCVSLLWLQTALAFPIVISRDLTLVDPEISTKKAIKEAELKIKADEAKGIFHPEKASGFRVARTGAPDFKKFQQMCKIGIRRMVVMSQNGNIEEEFANTEWGKKECPGFKVVYNEEQRTGVPLSKTFLAKFDRFIEEAKRDGVGLAFRCNCGCHRTGRLAAYYRMKYLNKPAKESVHDQRSKAGIASLLYRKLVMIQIKALENYIKNEPCSVAKLETVEQKYCVQETDAIELKTVPADDDEALNSDDDSKGNDHISVNNSSGQKERSIPVAAQKKPEAATSKAE